MKFLQKWCKKRIMNLILHVTCMSLYLERVFWKDTLFAFYMGYSFLLDFCEKMKRVFSVPFPNKLVLIATASSKLILSLVTYISNTSCPSLLQYMQICPNLIYYDYEIFSISITKSYLRLLALGFFPNQGWNGA